MASTAAVNLALTGTAGREGRRSLKQAVIQASASAGAAAGAGAQAIRAGAQAAGGGAQEGAASNTAGSTVYGHTAHLGMKVRAALKEGTYRPVVDAATLACAAELLWWQGNVFGL